MKNSALKICNTSIEPGERVALALPTPEMTTCVKMHIPIHVVHGVRKGPCLVIFGAMHGDEINTVAIIERFLCGPWLNGLSGTVIAIPVLNVFGLLLKSRNYLDASDLETSFPGNNTGSFAERQAYLVSEHILSKATHCIDLHTGGMQYYRLSQVVTSFRYPEAFAMAQAFGAPVIRNTEESRGLLWMLHRKGKEVPSILYEVGESFRVDEQEIQSGVDGIVSVMQHLGMTQGEKIGMALSSPVVESCKVVSPGSGLVVFAKQCGMQVNKNELLASISDPFGTGQRFTILSPVKGMIIAAKQNAIVGEGDLLCEVAILAESTSQKKGSL